MTDNAQTSSHMYAGFGHGGVTPNYNGIADQGRPCNEFSQYGAPFSQYGQGNTRAGYGVGGPSLQREGMVSNRHEMNWGSMNTFQSGCPPGQHQQRYLPSSGMPPGLPQSQLPGSAPTLNQLLMSPSNDQRFSGMCSDYSNSNQKASGPENADHVGYGVPHCGWGGQQRMSIGPYQQQMGSAPLVSQTSTNQGVGMYEVNRRANIAMGNRYPPPPLAPLPPALSSHHGSSSQNAPQFLGNMQSNLTAINPLCGQMQQQQSFSPNHSLVPTASHLQPSPSTTPLSQQSDSGSINIKAQSSPQPLPTSKQKSKKQPKRQRQSKAQMNIQESGMNDEADNSTSHPTPAGSNSSHPLLGGQLPNAAPSPAGSVSSRSNTPASLSGNMVGSPSTNHLDGQGRILSPFHSQGGNIPSGVGSGGTISGNMHNLQQQMMPPPSMFPSHSGVSPGPSKVHVPPPPPLSPHMISTGSSQHMSAPPYNNVQYNNSHYGGRGPPGLIPGYSGGGHHELINGPHNHLSNYGPSGMINRSTGYSVGSFGNCLEGPGHFGTGYGVHPVGPSLGIPVSGGASSVDSVGYQATSKSGCSGEHGPCSVSGRMPSSVEDGSYSGRPVSSMADAPISSSQRPSFPVTPVADHIPYSSGSDGGLVRNQYGMPPPYEVAGLAQQQHNNAPAAFGKPFIHSTLNRPGAGMFMRDHNPMIPGDERSRPSSRSMDSSDVASSRVSSLPGPSAGEKIFLKRPYDPMSYHGDGSLPIHYSPNPHVNSSSSRGLPDDTNILPAIPGHHGQPYRADDTLPVHPSMQTNMGPPATNSYMMGDQGAMFGKVTQESNPGFAGTAVSSGFPKDKWMRQDQFQPSDFPGKGSTPPDRERPRIYDEGSTSDTQSSDLGGASSLPADDLVKFPGNIGQEGLCSGNGSLLNRVLTASIDDGKKSKSAKPKKQKQEKMSGLVTPSSMTPDHDAFDDISNASRPSSPKSEGNDVLNKLAEMGDEPDRRMFLDQLFTFMEEIRTPIISIPMISKTAIDLYRLYHLVREHGGMVEVTKNKKWRDISGALNIGPSSSAGFTLKKNYGKHLFGFECRFDRGNVDPVPILAMLEQPVKKESKKAAAERAAAAAANTQDMYRMSAGQQFGCFPGANVHLPNGLDSSCNPDMIPGTPHQLPYDSPVGMMRHPGNMPNGGMIHPGLEGSMPPAHGMRNIGGGHGMMQANCAGDIINIQDPFSDIPNQGSAALLRPGLNYMDYPGNVAGMTQRGLYGATGNTIDRTPKVSFGSPVATKSSLSPPMVRVDSTVGGGTYEGSQSDSLDGRSSLVGHDVAGGSQDSFQEYGNARRPPASGISSQRSGVESIHATNRYEPLPQQPQPHMMSGEHEGAHHCRPSDEQTNVDQNYYGSMQASVHPRPISDQQGGFSHGHGGYPSGYISGQRILPPPVGVEKYYAPGAPGSLIDASGQQPYAGSASVLPSRYEMPTPPHQRPMMKTEHRDGYSADCDIRKEPPWISPGGLTPSYPVSYTPNTMLRSGHHSQGFSHSSQMGISQQKVDRSDRKVQMIPSRSEFHFPEDSVEAVQPRTVKRRRYTHKQLGPVNPWKLMMSLKSGLIAESTYALEVLSILLHDDSTVMWFGLQHLPGLVEVLLEHFRRCLIQIFPSDFDDLELGLEKQDIVWLSRIPKENKEVEITQQLKVEVEKEVDDDIGDGSLQIEGNVAKTSNGVIVIFEENSQEETLMFDDKKWDVFEEIDSSLFDWQMGRGDTSAHILTRFTTETSFEFFEEKFFGRTNLSQIAENKLRISEVVDREKKDTRSVEHNTKPADDDAAILSNLCDQTDNDKVKLEEASDIPAAVSDHDDADKLESKDADCHKLITMDAEDEVRALEGMKRKWSEEEDIEISQLNDHSLLLVKDSQTDVSRRCMSISNIFRGLSFVPSNESEMSKHPGLLLIIGKLLKLYHTHAKQSHDSTKIYANAACSEKMDDLPDDSNSKARWCSETLEVLREDTFVILANISGQLDLSLYPEEIVSPILNGLLHWVTCSAACALDPLPTMPLSYSLSPRRLVLETLCKLCIADSNVDLLLAMPPYSRTVLFLSNLVQLVAESGDQVVREFAIVLISSLVQADSSAARAIALHRPSISILLDFIELADHRAVHVVNTQGLAMLKGSPEMMGTSLDMLRRAASILCHMAEVPENKMIFARYHHRLLHLVMSQIMDQKVAAILAEVLYNSSFS